MRNCLTQSSFGTSYSLGVVTQHHQKQYKAYQLLCFRPSRLMQTQINWSFVPSNEIYSRYEFVRIINHIPLFLSTEVDIFLYLMFSYEAF